MLETKSKIKVFGDSVLRKKAKPVGDVSSECRQILSQMAKSMYDGQGIGLAAPQIGISLRMIVVDIGEGLYKLINPKIIRKHGTQINTEGCLSVPGVCIKVKRAKTVWLEAEDENGENLSMQAKDLFACVLQHEIDHLNGKLIIDYASILEKMRIKKKLSALKINSKTCELKL